MSSSNKQSKIVILANEKLLALRHFSVHFYVTVVNSDKVLFFLIIYLIL